MTLALPGDQQVQVTSPRTLGAMYSAALLSGDLSMVACCETAFTAEELLTAVSTQLVVLARREAVNSGRTVTEVGDGLVRGAQLLDAQEGRPDGR